MKKLNLLIALLAVMLPMALYGRPGCDVPDAKKGAALRPEKMTLAGYNKVNRIDSNYYFTYSFVRRPRLGTSILRVIVYDKNKNVYNGFSVFAAADMPCMRGAHDSGYKQLRPNKKGELLVPINFVMRGVWEIDLKFMKDNKQVYNGIFELKI